MGCSPTGNKSVEPYKIKFNGEAQGTYYAITYIAEDSLVSQMQVDSLLDAFNLCASMYEPRSIISGFNNNNAYTLADPQFIAIFNASMEVSRRTGGAFDVTVGQLVNAWGFGFKNKENISQKLIDSLLQFTGYQKVSLKDRKLIKEDPRIMIDFNAIAQGFSVDYLALFLEAKGVQNYLIDIGGEVKGKGQKPSGEKWMVAIEKPAKNKYSNQEIQAKLHLDNYSLATSGNYRKYYEENGVRYSHTIDPSTGYPAKHNLLSVSVMAKDCTTADAYATAFMVMGFEKSKEFLLKNKDLGLEAYFIYSVEEKNETFLTDGFKKFIVD